MATLPHQSPAPILFSAAPLVKILEFPSTSIHICTAIKSAFAPQLNLLAFTYWRSWGRFAPPSWPWVTCINILHTMALPVAPLFSILPAVPCWEGVRRPRVDHEQPLLHAAIRSIVVRHGVSLARNRSYSRIATTWLTVDLSLLVEESVFLRET
jgi:hypothetical protein